MQKGRCRTRLRGDRRSVSLGGSGCGANSDLKGDIEDWCRHVRYSSSTTQSNVPNSLVIEWMLTWIIIIHMFMIQKATHRNQSTAMMRVMSSVGSPTEVSTITMVTRPAWGMPAAPILAAVAVILDWREAHRHTEMKQCQRFLLLLSVLVLIFSFFLPDGDDLTKIHLHVVDLGNKDGCQRLVKGRSVHVNGGTDGQHETRDSLVNFVVLLQTFKGDREGGWAGTWKNGNGSLKEQSYILGNML